MTILCTTCQQTKPASEFQKKIATTVLERGWRGTKCRSCVRKWERSERPRFGGGPDALRQCARCKTEKKESEYYKSIWRNARSPWCKECFRSYYRDKRAAEPGYTGDITRRRRQERLAQVREIKAKIGCSRCTERHPACLDFHHPEGRVGKNLPPIAVMVARGWSVERLREEIQKCVVLCSNCHRKLHYDAGHPLKKLPVFQPKRRLNPTMKKTVQMPVSSS